MRIAASLALCLSLALPVAAEEGRFAVFVAGFGAGTIAYSGAESGGRYTANGQVASTGLARSLYPARITVAVTGAVKGNRYSPGVYTEETNKRGETKTGTYRFSGGTPRVTKTPPDTRRKPFHADPEDQKGVVDPMTAAFAILRDRPAALACDLDISPYDGRERTRIRLSGGKRSGDRLVCPGRYTRVAGFSEKDMRSRDWSFTVIYTILPDGTHRVSEVIVPTTLGKVRMRRR